MIKPTKMQALRQRRKEAGLVRLELYVTPKERDKIKKYAAQLTQARNN